jgi:dienelactone hydrolase
MDAAIRDAFRDRGRNDPYHPHVMHLARTYATALEDQAAADAATIPVERIGAPLLLLSGSDDAVWPSGPMAEALLRRRRDAGVAADDHHEHYEGGGHLLRLGRMPSDVTTTGGIALGGTREGIAAAQADATRRVFDFFARTLGG